MPRNQETERFAAGDFCRLKDVASHERIKYRCFTRLCVIKTELAVLVFAPDMHLMVIGHDGGVI